MKRPAWIILLAFTCFQTTQAQTPQSNAAIAKFYFYEVVNQKGWKG